MGDCIMFPLKFCLFFRIFFPSLSSADPSENPNFKLTRAFSNTLGPGAAGPAFRDVIFLPDALSFLLVQPRVSSPVSLLRHLGPDGSLSDSVEHGGM